MHGKIYSIFLVTIFSAGSLSPLSVTQEGVGSIRLGDKLSVETLQKAFPGYSVSEQDCSNVDGEECVPLFHVSNKKTSAYFYHDDNGGATCADVSGPSSVGPHDLHPGVPYANVISTAQHLNKKLDCHFGTVPESDRDDLLCVMEGEPSVGYLGRFRPHVWGLGQKAKSRKARAILVERDRVWSLAKEASDRRIEEIVQSNGVLTTAQVKDVILESIAWRPKDCYEY